MSSFQLFVLFLKSFLHVLNMTLDVYRGRKTTKQQHFHVLTCIQCSIFVLFSVCNIPNFHRKYLPKIARKVKFLHLPSHRSFVMITTVIILCKKY